MAYDTLDDRRPLLDREGFLKRFTFSDVKLTDGSVVRIRALPASYIVNSADESFSAANLLVHSLCDEDGELMFTKAESDQAMSVDAASLKTLIDAIIDLNGLKRADDETGSAEKN